MSPGWDVPDILPEIALKKNKANDKIGTESSKTNRKLSLLTLFFNRKIRQQLEWKCKI